MIKFNSLKEFDEYIPNCLICGKRLKLFTYLDNKSYELVNDFTILKRHKTTFPMDLRILSFFYKKCKTCVFEINMYVSTYQPELSFMANAQSFEFTLRGKRVSYYRNCHYSHIFLNEKNINFPIDLSKIKNFKHLKKRISLVLTFQ